MKVLDLKQRIRDRLQDFIQDPNALPRLRYARYKSSSKVISVLTTPDGTKRYPIYVGSERPEKTQPHVMHTQHRVTLVKILDLLVHRLDVASSECVVVNPRYNIRRPLYLIDIEKATGLTRRTVQRGIASLVRSGYILRDAGSRKIHLTRHLFGSLSLNVAYDCVRNQIMGLARRSKFVNPTPYHQNKRTQRILKGKEGKTITNAYQGQDVQHPAHGKFHVAKGTSKPATKESKVAGASALDAMKAALGIRPKTPPLPS